MTPRLVKTVLYTDAQGFARFREEAIDLPQGTEAARLSAESPVHALQWRQSPPGFQSEWHCTAAPQWTFILAGKMEIGLRDGSSRVFSPGEFFYSSDTLPLGVPFNPEVHGHKSRQVGDEALVTLFVRGAAGDN
ncbi:MAG: hypothetical protein FWG81_05525 [Betaproteobacteria bacterium]|nr:hypothetical protein [Betaproteobacteria bacterium]